MARAHFVKSARKADKAAGIKVGDSYWWWKFRYGGKHKSKTRPRPSQLTQSEFWSNFYSIQEDTEDVVLESASDLQELIDNLRDQLSDLASEQEEKLSNMPDQLQEAESGQLLQERADALNELISELEHIETEYDDDDMDEDGKAEWLAERKEEIDNALSGMSCS